jgi:hypothetical protein
MRLMGLVDASTHSLLEWSACQYKHDSSELAVSQAYCCTLIVLTSDRHFTITGNDDVTSRNTGNLNTVIQDDASVVVLSTSACFFES